MLLRSIEIMKLLINIMLIVGAALSAWAAPFLISDPYVLSTDPNMNPVNFIIHGIGGTDITITATTLTNSNIVLEYDLATLPNGQYSVTAAAVNVFGGESPFSTPPFPFTKGVPAPPSNLRISQTMLVWVPILSKPRWHPSPLRPPLVPLFS